MSYFKNLKDYQAYLNENPFHEVIPDFVFDKSISLDQKIVRDTYYSVTPDMEDVYTAELDDLIRLHFLVTSRRSLNVMEFGSGFSTAVISHALQYNQEKYQDFVKENLRKSDPFRITTIENSKKWAEETKKKLKFNNVDFHVSNNQMTTFNGRICTMFETLPNLSPDFIYLDGPDQFSAKGNVNGITTDHIERLPMSGDLLKIEHFLLPGTLIVVDGRTANARFLKANFQRDWDYHYFEEFDQHFFELSEEPLGIYNKKQIEFSKNLLR